MNRGQAFQVISALMLLTVTGLLVPTAKGTSVDMRIPSAERSDSAWQALSVTGEHHTFLRLLAVAGMQRVLDSEHAVTVFAPTDEAFAGFGDDRLAELLDEPGHAELRRLLGGHIVWGVFDTTKVTGLSLRPNVGGFTLRLTPDESGDALLLANDVAVRPLERASAHGSVFLTDQLITPPPMTAAVAPTPHAPDCHGNPHQSGGGELALGGGASSSDGESSSGEKSDRGGAGANNGETTATSESQRTKVVGNSVLGGSARGGGSGSLNSPGGGSGGSSEPRSNGRPGGGGCSCQ
ncbi:MAG: fasciclin domain-containing protein [Planctomycetota bacterium]